MSLITRYLDFETLHYYFEHVSDEVMQHVLNNVKDTKKICFLTQKYICYSCTLRKIYQFSFTENSVCSSRLLELIHSDLLELLNLSYSKYKWVITFLHNYFSYYNIIFLYKKSEVVEAIKLIFWMWSYTTYHPIKRLYTDNTEEYIILELQFFLREQGIIYKTSALYIHQ